MRILIADDEKAALEEMREIVQEVKPDAEIHAFTNPEKLLEFARETPCEVAFLDIEMGCLSGMEVAKQIKVWHPATNVIFVTGYSEYMYEAIKMRVSGYLLKPATGEAVEEELKNLRNPVKREEKDVLVAQCFGTFDVFVNGKSLSFERSKTKELLAYLIDRRGSAVTSGELRAVLWEDEGTDENTGVYLQKLKKDLTSTLKKAGVGDVFVTSWNQYAIRPEKISCDYYDYLENRPEGIRAYNGQYMLQYSWGELENTRLLKQF